MNGGFSFSINGGSTDNNCYGSYIDIAFSPRDDAGAAIGGWANVYVDIFYLTDDTEQYAFLLRDVGTDGVEWQGVNIPSLSGLDNVFGLHEALSSTALAWLAANLGRTLYFNFKDAATSPSLTKLYSGTVAFESSEYDQAVLANSRLDWIRNDVENVVFPRLRRVLSLLGENMLLDNFSYDNAGNITGLRVRCFDTTTNAAAATIDNTDAETGEEVTLSVTQTHDLPRNLRSSHLSVADTDATDRTATINDTTDGANAPGNTGDWPS